MAQIVQMGGNSLNWLLFRSLETVIVLMGYLQWSLCKTVYVFYFSFQGEQSLTFPWEKIFCRKSLIKAIDNTLFSSTVVLLKSYNIIQHPNSLYCMPFYLTVAPAKKPHFLERQKDEKKKRKRIEVTVMKFYCNLRKVAYGFEVIGIWFVFSV